MTVRRAHIVSGFTVSLLLATLLSVPVFADTASELKAARQRLTVVQGELNRLAREHAAAQVRLAKTEAGIERVQARISRVQTRMARVQASLAARAREAYESGGVGTLELILSSDSFSQFSDRVQFLGSLAQGDSDLLVEASVTGERLRRAQSELSDLSDRQSATIKTLARQKAAIADKLEEARALEARLEGRLV
ncbi:MAG: PcsB-like coiled-coil domain-containing protein, partial [Actinomycetota bacterium]